jgi:hypothetical protein
MHVHRGDLHIQQRVARHAVLLSEVLLKCCCCCCRCPRCQVEPIALLANSPETGFVGVYMYCDDQATIKQLPPNPRATAIAATAGMHIQVRAGVQAYAGLACWVVAACAGGAGSGLVSLTRCSCRDQPVIGLLIIGR